MSFTIKGKTIWTHPRTGSTSLYKYFDIPEDEKTRHTKIDEDSSDIAVTVRNPLDLIVSWWKLSNIKSLANFIEQGNHDQWVQIIAGVETMFYLWEPQCTLIRYENLVGDLSAFMGEPVFGLPWYNRTPGKDRHWSYYYDHRAFDAAYARFEWDIETYKGWLS